MKNWFNKNYRTIIVLSFLIPIITVAVVSITHVTKWYGISNPLTWAIYLSIGIEIAALSALAAISVNMGSKVYFPFGIVTLIQFIGNIYFAYSYIDINSQSFISWVELVSPLLENLGVEPTDYVGHKRYLAFFSGGMLPIISLTFLHMLVKFTQEEKKQIPNDVKEKEETIEELPIIDSKDIVSEVSRVRLSENDLEVLEKILNNQIKTSDIPMDEKKVTNEPEKSNINEVIKNWEEILPSNLKPMNEESPIIDMVTPSENQMVSEDIVGPTIEVTSTPVDENTDINTNETTDENLDNELLNKLNVEITPPENIIEPEVTENIPSTNEDVEKKK